VLTLKLTHYPAVHLIPILPRAMEWIPCIQIELRRRRRLLALAVVRQTPSGGGRAKIVDSR
jgi:hypothetical protein